MLVNGTVLDTSILQYTVRIRTDDGTTYGRSTKTLTVNVIVTPLYGKLNPHGILTLLISNQEIGRGWVKIPWIGGSKYHGKYHMTLVSSTNKTDHHDITEILLKVVLNQQV
jgi:hypothetical protein